MCRGSTEGGGESGRTQKPPARRVKRMTLLFVYGTLKRGGRNHRLLADQRFVAKVVTVSGFAVVDLGPFPGMVREGGSGVRGELYEVSDCCLDELDDFEGVPDLFS